MNTHGMAVSSFVKLVECPRDAMQGWPHIIPTATKISYLNTLLRIGFDTLDFGSFVSPKAIPQMADTKDVLQGLDLSGTDTKLLAIVANLRGAVEAVSYEQVAYLGFPFSVSETFQKKNANATIETSFSVVEEIQELCLKNSKSLVIYISMGFGNPYGDEYSEELVTHWVGRMVELGVGIISLADTVGLASASLVESVTHKVIGNFPGIETGVHLHSRPEGWKQKVSAALKAGCRRIDGALNGIGGCPMAGDDLVGNIDTSRLIPYLQEQRLLSPINENALQDALRMAGSIFV